MKRAHEHAETDGAGHQGKPRPAAPQAAEKFRAKDLAAIDRLCEDRYDKRFTALTDAQRRAILDEVAYTTNRDATLHPVITFFSSFRDLTASGFWTTKMGVADLQYQGNVFVADWNGCPQGALEKLGVRYSNEH